MTPLVELWMTGGAKRSWTESPWSAASTVYLFAPSSPTNKSCRRKQATGEQGHYNQNRAENVLQDLKGRGAFDLEADAAPSVVETTAPDAPADPVSTPETDLRTRETERAGATDDDCSDHILQEAPRPKRPRRAVEAPGELENAFDPEADAAPSVSAPETDLRTRDTERAGSTDDDCCDDILQEAPSPKRPRRAVEALGELVLFETDSEDDSRDPSLRSSPEQPRQDARQMEAPGHKRPRESVASEIGAVKIGTQWDPDLKQQMFRFCNGRARCRFCAAVFTQATTTLRCHWKSHHEKPPQEPLLTDAADAAKRFRSQAHATSVNKPGNSSGSYFFVFPFLRSFGGGIGYWNLRIVLL
ncbi:hypothetical protein DIPPA_25748 [Diplonema papillatum]|nr:hypothetical protein DIPPA_25748 [Diplonema papillatum]